MGLKLDSGCSTDIPKYNLNVLNCITKKNLIKELKDDDTSDISYYVIYTSPKDEDKEIINKLVKLKKSKKDFQMSRESEDLEYLKYCESATNLNYFLMFKNFNESSKGEYNIILEKTITHLNKFWDNPELNSQNLYFKDSRDFKSFILF